MLYGFFVWEKLLNAQGSLFLERLFNTLAIFYGIVECPRDFFWEGLFNTLADFFWEGLLNALGIFSGKDC